MRHFANCVSLVCAILLPAAADTVPAVYQHCGTARALAAVGDTLWIGTSGCGLVCMNTVSGEMSYHDSRSGALADDAVVDIDWDSARRVLWVAGAYSLSRYDGATWSEHGDSSVFQSSVSALTVDPLGRPWVMTKWNGLFRYDGGRWVSALDENPGFPQALLRSFSTFLGASADSTIWIGVRDHFCGTMAGLISLRDGVWKSYAVGCPVDVVLDAGGDPWLQGTYPLVGGVWEIEDGALVSRGQTVGRWGVLTAGADGGMWAVTSAGVERWQDSAFRVVDTSFRPEYVYPSESAVTLDKDNRLWLCAPLLPPQTAIRFSEAGWDTLSYARCELPAGNLWGIAVDADHTVWIAAAAGLIRHDDSGWSVIDNVAGAPVGVQYPASSHWGPVFDSDGAVWCVARTGVAQITDAQAVLHSGMHPDIEKYPPLSIAAGPDGTMWIGCTISRTYMEAPCPILRQEQDGTWSSPANCAALMSTDVRGISALAPVTHDECWVVLTDGRLLHVVNDTLILTDHSPWGSTNSVLVARDGRLWIGTESGVFAAPADDPSASVRVSPSGHASMLLEDTDGSLWFSGAGAKMSRLAPDGTLYRFSSANSPLPPYADVHAMALAPDSSLWITTNRGLCHMEPGGTGGVWAHAPGAGTPKARTAELAACAAGIRMFLPRGGMVTIELFDCAGRKLATIPAKYRDAGRHIQRLSTTGSGLAIVRMRVEDPCGGVLEACATVQRARAR